MRTPSALIGSLFLSFLAAPDIAFQADDDDNTSYSVSADESESSDSSTLQK